MGRRWAKVAPKWAKMGQVGTKMAPSWLQDGPKTGQVEPKMVKMGQVGSKMAPSWFQDGLKTGQVEPKMGPKTDFRTPRRGWMEDGWRTDRRWSATDDFKKWRLGPWGGRRGSPKSS